VRVVYFRVQANGEVGQLKSIPQSPAKPKYAGLDFGALRILFYLLGEMLNQNFQKSYN
jgi:hypothetical protein